MSELRSALEAWAAEDPNSMPDARVEEGHAELRRALDVLEALALRWLGELDRRGIWAVDGSLSPSSWLARRFGTTQGAASGEVRLARGLRQMPKTGEALVEGEVSVSEARMLAAARETDPEGFAEAESYLLDAARDLSVTDLGRVLGYWRNAATARREAEAGEQALAERRRLHVSPTMFGMVRIDGDLDPETGESVMTALGAVLDAEARSPDPEDHRSPAQRRADALGEICQGWLDLAERPTVGGERPHLAVTVDLQMLLGRGARTGAGCGPYRGGRQSRGRRCELTHSGPVDPEVVRRLGCDAWVSRVVLEGDSEPLDVGRRTKVVPPPLRRALVVRDAGCRFPGCGRPPSWTDAHHVQHWADGGSTALSNLVLLCRRHHRMIHWKRFVLEMEEGHPVFRRPDGSVLEERGPP